MTAPAEPHGPDPDELTDEELEQAAGATLDRAYSAGHFGLDVGGEPAGYLKSLETGAGNPQLANTNAPVPAVGAAAALPRRKLDKKS